VDPACSLLTRLEAGTSLVSCHVVSCRLVLSYLVSSLLLGLGLVTAAPWALRKPLAGATHSPWRSCLAPRPPCTHGGGKHVSSGQKGSTGGLPGQEGSTQGLLCSKGPMTLSKTGQTVGSLGAKEGICCPLSHSTGLASKRLSPGLVYTETAMLLRQDLAAHCAAALRGHCSLQLGPIE
jgi:hypothetical protein